MSPFRMKKMPSTAMVQIPTRVPWRLKPSTSESRSPTQRAVVPDLSVQSESRRAVTPVSQQISNPLRRQRQRVPQVSSWFLPQRQRLIEHFQNRRLNRDNPVCRRHSFPKRLSAKCLHWAEVPPWKASVEKWVVRRLLPATILPRLQPQLRECSVSKSKLCCPFARRYIGLSNAKHSRESCQSLKFRGCSPRSSKSIAPI